MFLYMVKEVLFDKYINNVKLDGFQFFYDDIKN